METTPSWMEMNSTTLPVPLLSTGPTPIPGTLLDLMGNETEHMEILHPFMEGGNESSQGSGGSNMTCYVNPLQRSVYPLALPVMIFFCVLSIFVNLLIVISARWCRRPMSPTLYFSISLALADAFASLALAIGLIFNSLLPCVFDVHIAPGNHCITLVIEVLRLGSILITVKHLLALGINHWIGIVRPLHYAATMTRRTAWLVIILSWASPILLLFIYFSSHPGQGFLSLNCGTVEIFKKNPFRAIFASFFFAPLLLMSMIYLHIFLIVKNHHQHRLRYQSCQQLRRNIKAVVTTVLILGTYILGWMPGILWFIIVCDDCLIHLKLIPVEVTLPAQIVINTLIILKAFVNPIIYAARMSDIQLALRKMQYEVMYRCCKQCVPEHPPMDPLERGSVGMSSCTSNMSTHRAGTVHSINAARHAQLSPGTNPLENSDTGSRNNNRVAFEMSERN